MSYLHPTRFTFAGSYQAAPSTINNSPSNYSKSSTAQTDGSWNPDGNGFFRVQGCTVRSALVNGAGVASDPVIGLAFVSVPNPVPGKLVDLDVDQQGVSQIWGMQLQLGAAGGANFFSAIFKVAPFTDLWRRRMPAPAPAPSRGSPYLSAYYQSVLEEVTGGEGMASPFLQALKALSPGKLSIKFNVDLYNWYNPAQQPPVPGEPFPFTFGRIVGTVGPYLEGEPEHFIGGRSLAPIGTGTNFAPCEVGQSSIFVDLGNSLRTLGNGSVDPNQGNLRLAILDPNYRNAPTDSPEALVAEKGAPLGALAAADPAPGLTQWVFDQPLDYTSYETTAGIVAVPFDPSLRGQIESAPLGIVSVDAQGRAQQVLLGENPSGWFVRADDFVFRLDPGGQTTLRLRASRFGKAPETPMEIGLSTQLLADGPGLEALKVPDSVPTDAQGWADLPITADDPGYARENLEIDGQVYAINYTLPAGLIPDDLLDSSNFISGLIHTDWAKIAANFSAPTWAGDVERVLNQYDVLYPVMRQKIGIALGNYAAVKEHIEVILKYMSFPRTDPRHMPVTRDLSASKLQLIRNWAANGAPQS